MRNASTYTLDGFESEIDAIAFQIANKGASELVQDKSSSAYADKVYDLYQSILNGVKYKENRALKKVKVE
jgi:hypothetical protein